MEVTLDSREGGKRRGGKDTWVGAAAVARAATEAWLYECDGGGGGCGNMLYLLKRSIYMCI